MRPFTPKKGLIFLFVTLGMIALLINCKKIDYRHGLERMKIDLTEKFFQVPDNALPIVKTVAAYIKKQNDQFHFINDIAKRNGIPRWDKAKVVAQRSDNNTRITGGGGGTDSIVLIPTIQLDSNIVHSFLACHVYGGSHHDDSVKIRVFDGAAYKAYPNSTRVDTISSSFVTLMCMALDYDITGRQWYKLKDSTLIDTTIHPVNGIKYVQIIPANPMALMLPITFIDCETITMPAPWVIGVAPGGSTPMVTFTTCTDYTFWVEVIDESPVYTGPTPSGGGGGGSWWDPANQPCRALPGTNPCGSDAPLPFVPVVNDMGEYNPYQADTIGYSNALRDVYRCTYSFIHDSLPNVNYIAQLTGTNVFNDSAYMHLVFDTSTTLTQESQSSADTQAGNVFVDGFGFTHYRATIRFNGWYLRNGTKEYMISTIVHEVMHAIFNLRWGQYLNWLQYHDTPYDSNFIKAHFPIYWYYLANQTVPLTELQDHEIMAAEYLNLHNNIVQQFWNPDAPTATKDSVMKAMGYCGLTQTTAWGLLPSQGMDTCKYRAIQVCAEKSLTGHAYNTGGVCRNYSLHYADSLKLRPSCN